MTTQELVQKLIEYVSTGRNVDFEMEYYAPEVVSYEQDGAKATGLDAVIAKTKAAHDGIGEMHGGGVSKAYVAQDSFLLVFDMDFTPKGGERMQMQEYGFYKVSGGKVVEEHFYAMPMAS